MSTQDTHQHRRFSLFNLIVNNKKKDNNNNQTTNILHIENKNKLDAFYSNTSNNGIFKNNLNNNKNSKLIKYPYSSPSYNKDKRYSCSTSHKSNTLSVVEGSRWGSLYVEKNAVLREEFEDKSRTWRGGKVSLNDGQISSTKPPEFCLNKSEIYYRHFQIEDEDDDEGDDVDGVCLRKKSNKSDRNMKEGNKMEEREGDGVSVKSKTRGSLKRFFDMFSKNKNAYNNNKKENYTSNTDDNLKYNTLKPYINDYTTLPSASFLLGTSNKNKMAPLKPPRTSLNERHLLNRRTFSTTILEDEITNKPVGTDLHDFQMWSCQGNLNNPQQGNLSGNSDYHGNELFYEMKTDNNHYDNINIHNNRYNGIKKKELQGVKLRRKSEDLKRAEKKENWKGVSNGSHVSMSDVSLPLQGHSPQTPPSYNNTLSEVMKTMMVKSYSNDNDEDDCGYCPMKTSSLSRIIESPISQHNHHNHYHKPNHLHPPHPNLSHFHREDEIPFHYENNNLNDNCDMKYVRDNDNDVNNHYYYSSLHHRQLSSDLACMDNESMIRMSKSLEPHQLNLQNKTINQQTQPPQQLQQQPQQIWQQQRQIRLQQQRLNNQQQQFNSEKQTNSNKTFELKQTFQKRFQQQTQQNKFILPELNFKPKHNNINNNNNNNTNYFPRNISDSSSLKAEINFAEQTRHKNKSRTTANLKNKFDIYIENSREEPCLNNNNNGNQSEASEINRILHANNNTGFNVQSNNFNNNKPDSNKNIIIGSLTLGLPNPSRLIKHGLNDPRRTVLEGRRSQTLINKRSSENVVGVDKKEINKNQKDEKNFNVEDKGDNCSYDDNGDDNVYGKVGVINIKNRKDFSNEVLNQKDKNEAARKLFFETLSSYHHHLNQHRHIININNNETSHDNTSMHIKHTNFLSQLSYEPKLLKNSDNIEQNNSNNNNDKYNNNVYDQQFDAFKESNNSGICERKNKNTYNSNNNSLNNVNNNSFNTTYNNYLKSSKSELNCENIETKKLPNSVEFSSNKKNGVMSLSDAGGFVDEEENDKGIQKRSIQTYPYYNKRYNSNTNIYNDSNINTNEQTSNNSSYNPYNNKTPDQINNKTLDNNKKNSLNNNTNYNTFNTNFRNKNKYNNKFRIHENENSKRESLDSGFDLRFEDRNSENHRNSEECRKSYFGKMSSQSCSSPLLSTCHIPFDFNLTPFNPELSHHPKNALTSTHRKTYSSTMEKVNLPISKIEKEVCIFNISESENDDLVCFFKELCSKLMSVEQAIGVLSQDSPEKTGMQRGLDEDEKIITINNDENSIEYNKNNINNIKKDNGFSVNEIIMIEKEMITYERGGRMNNEFCLSKLISENKNRFHLDDDKITTNANKNSNLNIEKIVNKYLWNHLPSFFVKIFCEDLLFSCSNNYFLDKKSSIHATKNTPTNTDSDINTTVEIHKNTIITTATPSNKTTDVDKTTTKPSTQTSISQTIHPNDNLSSLNIQSEELMTSLRSTMHDHVIKCGYLRKQVLKEVKGGLSGKLMRRLKCFCRESDNLSKLLVLLLRQAGRCGGSSAGCSDEIGKSNGDISTCSGVQEVLSEDKLNGRLDNGFKNSVEKNRIVSGDVLNVVKSKFDVNSHEKEDKEEEDLYFKYIDENSSGDERGEKKKIESNICTKNKQKIMVDDKKMQLNTITKETKVDKNEPFENYKNSISFIKSESMRSFNLNAEESESESDEEEFGNIGDILIPIKQQKLTELKLKIEDAMYLKNCIEGKGMVLWNGMVESGVGWRCVKRLFDLNACLFFIPIMVLCVEEGYRGKR